MAPDPQDVLFFLPNGEYAYDGGVRCYFIEYPKLADAQLPGCTTWMWKDSAEGERTAAASLKPACER